MPVISTNTAANTAVRYLNSNSQSQSDSLAKLASGSRINKASDDAAGLAISTKISSDVAALEQASTNASHGISILQTADGGAANISDILERMKTLASQSSSGTVTDTERAYIQAEFEQLQEEIDGITTSTRYNGQSLLDGTSDFSDDTIVTNASVAATLGQGTETGTKSGTAAELTFTTEDISVAANSVGTFAITVDGQDYAVELDNSSTATATSFDADDVALAIQTALASADVSVSVSGADVTITTNSTSADSEVAISTVAGGTGIDDLDVTDVTADTVTSADGTDEFISFAEGETLSFTVDDTFVTYTAEADEDLTGAQLATKLQAAMDEAGVTNLSVAATDEGAIEFTTKDGGSVTSVALAEATGTDASDLTLADAGITAGAVNGTDDAFEIAAGNSISFDVNDVTVTIDNTEGTEADTVTTQELVDAINDALAVAGEYNVSASINEENGAVEVTSVLDGEAGTVTIDNFDGDLDAENAFDVTDLNLSSDDDLEATSDASSYSVSGAEEDVATTGADVVVGSDASDAITLTISKLTSEALGVDELDVSTQAGAEKALSLLDNAIDEVSNARAEMGATMSRFEFRSAQIETSIENLEAAESAIADVDIASEQSNLSAASVMVQAAVAAAAQANQMPENLLKLLQ